MASEHTAHFAEAVTRGSQNWHAYRVNNGARSLNSYLFMVEPGRGFPVLIKAELKDRVDLIILQSGAEFSVNPEEFELHCGDPFVLRPELRDADVQAFDKHSKWFAQAYVALGLRGDCPVDQDIG
jgi:hypothetical protein